MDAWLRKYVRTTKLGCNIHRSCPLNVSHQTQIYTKAISCTAAPLSPKFVQDVQIKQAGNCAFNTGTTHFVFTSTAVIVWLSHTPCNTRFVTECKDDTHCFGDSVCCPNGVCTADPEDCGEERKFHSNVEASIDHLILYAII